MIFGHFGTCCTSDGEPLLQCFIKFLLRIISRLLDITFLPSWTKLFTKTFKKWNCLIWPFTLHCPPKCIETIGVLGTRQITLICLETYFLDLYHKLTWWKKGELNLMIFWKKWGKRITRIGERDCVNDPLLLRDWGPFIKYVRKNIRISEPPSLCIRRETKKTSHEKNRTK